MKRSEKSSVRKVRTIDEIKDLFTLVPSGGKIPTEKLRQALIQARVRRSGIYLGLTRKRAKGSPSYDDSHKFTSLADDRKSFARRLGIWKISNDRISLTERGESIKSELEQSPDRTNSILLDLLLESPYVAYGSFLERLAAKGGKFIIAGMFQSRKKEGDFKGFLKREGFLTDGASFHTIKDLFYDFGLLNWRKITLDNEERIFLTRDLYEYSDIPTLAGVFSMVTQSIPHSEVGQEEFGTVLVEAFQTLGLERETYHDVILIRDAVCEKLRLSDQKFARILQKVTKTGSASNKGIVTGVGPLVTRIPMGYALKLATLPIIFENEPITKLMVRTQ